MTKTATFAMNCFWQPQYVFSKLPGVIKTTVGYSGGEKEHPTYTTIGDHTETLEIIFDPTQISFEKLLEHFFESHDPTIEQKTQYRSIIFYHDDEQRRQAEEALVNFEERTSSKPLTEVRKAETFYPAEEYHQHYVAKNRVEYTHEGN